MRQSPTRRRNASSPRRNFTSPRNGSSHISENAWSILSRSLAASRRNCRFARLAITKPHFMPQLVETHEITALKIPPTGRDRFAVTGLRLFLKLEDQGTGSAVLHGRRQLAQTRNGFVQQFRHAAIIPYRPHGSTPHRMVRKKNIVRSKNRARLSHFLSAIYLDIRTANHQAVLRDTAT